MEEGTNMAGEIDPVRYGVLWQKVDDMTKKMDKLETNVEELLALANKSRGGFWAGMTIASFVGGVITFAIDHLFKK